MPELIGLNVAFKSVSGSFQAGLGRRAGDPHRMPYLRAGDSLRMPHLRAGDSFTMPHLRAGDAFRMPLIMHKIRKMMINQNRVQFRRFQGYFSSYNGIPDNILKVL